MIICEADLQSNKWWFYTLFTQEGIRPWMLNFLPTHIYSGINNIPISCTETKL